VNKYVKNAIKSYQKLGHCMTNCLLIAKPEDVILFADDDFARKPKLNGYAVIPLSDYYELTGGEIDKGVADRIVEFESELLKLKPIDKESD